MCTKQPVVKVKNHTFWLGILDNAAGDTLMEQNLYGSYERMHT